MAIKSTFDTIGSSESHVSSHDIIDGYFIHRPTHIEINVKSPYLAKLMKNDKELVYTDFGMVYDIDFIDDSILYQSMNKNNNCFLTTNHNPNMTYLRSPKLAEGFKTKIRGIVFPEDLATYEHKFNSIINVLVKHLTKPKPKKVKSKCPKSILEQIKVGLIYDGYGWVHNVNCACLFDTFYQPYRLCVLCENDSVMTRRNRHFDNIIPLGEVP